MELQTIWEAFSNINYDKNFDMKYIHWLSKFY